MVKLCKYLCIGALFFAPFSSINCNADDLIKIDLARSWISANAEYIEWLFEEKNFKALCEIGQNNNNKIDIYDYNTVSCEAGLIWLMAQSHCLYEVIRSLSVECTNSSFNKRKKNNNTVACLVNVQNLFCALKASANNSTREGKGFARVRAICSFFWTSGSNTLTNTINNIQMVDNLSNFRNPIWNSPFDGGELDSIFRNANYAGNVNNVNNNHKEFVSLLVNIIKRNNNIINLFTTFDLLLNFMRCRQWSAFDFNNGQCLEQKNPSEKAWYSCASVTKKPAISFGQNFPVNANDISIWRGNWLNQMTNAINQLRLAQSATNIPPDIASIIKKCINNNPPVQNQPLQNIPVQNLQQNIQPPQNVPVQNQPVQNLQQNIQPPQNVPVQNQPLQNLQQNPPVQNVQPPQNLQQNPPVQNVPVQNQPVQNLQQNIQPQNIQNPQQDALQPQQDTLQPLQDALQPQQDALQPLQDAPQQPQDILQIQPNDLLYFQDGLTYDLPMQLASKDFDYFEGQDGSDLEMGIISAKNEKNDDLNKKINSTSNPAEHLVDQFKNNIQQAAVPVIHAKPHPVTLLPVYSTHSVAEVPNYNYTNYASNRRNKWHGSKPNRRQKVRRRRSQRSNKRRGRRNDKSYNYTSTYSRGRRSRPFDDKRGTRRMRRRSTRIK